MCSQMETRNVIMVIIVIIMIILAWEGVEGQEKKTEWWDLRYRRTACTLIWSCLSAASVRSAASVLPR